MTERFRWHPEARLFDSTGAEVQAQPAASPILPDTPQGLAAAIGLPAFRIGAPDQPPPAPHEQPVVETLTSGSTGQPRRIRRTQGSWTASFSVNADFGIGPGARIASLGRLIHSLSLYGAVEGLHLGAHVHLLADLRPDRQRAALTTLAPSAQIREFYGAAETSFITLADETTPEASVGRPYPGVQITLGPTGEVWVRSPYLFLGYAGTIAPPAFHLSPNIPAGGPSPEPVARSSRAEARQKACASALDSLPPTTRWRDGWLSVGEIGNLDNGFLTLRGRAGRMVTVADQNVFPEEIEGFLAALPGVTRAAVLPVPDAKRGHALIAVLQGDPSGEAAILAALRSELGPLKSPKALIWREDWPMLPSGKTDLKALEAAIWPG